LGLGDGWHAELAKRPLGAVLRVSNEAGGGALEIEVRLTESGPVVRARASALEIETDGDLVARCERFRLEARGGVEVVSDGPVKAIGRNVDIKATHGSARVRANDDVQLLGEQVLLNCDRAEPLPRWAVTPSAPSPSLPAQNESGDPDLLRALVKDM
jgi:hypothetical protein